MLALLKVKSATDGYLQILECSKTVKEVDPDPLSRSFMPRGEIWIKVEKRTDLTIPISLTCHYFEYLKIKFEIENDIQYLPFENASFVENNILTFICHI
jgi:hypothetical protein